ncbi:MAG: hypothetical protein ABW221_22595 [Vicinamibacteria bacterium]
MARVQGIKEKLHWPLYDAFVVPEQNGGSAAPTFASEMAKRDARILRFFVDVQNKTRLETNLQASGQLPSLNSYEVRAMRVVVSPLLRRDRKSDPKGKDEAHDFETDNVLADLIYNSVTSLLVGEKTMIEMPTYFFPAGAGVSPGNQGLPSHGQPDPMATFRFSEPVKIEPNQNFRVEILFPQGVPERSKQALPCPLRIGDAPGPLRLWVVLDGYLTRDVQ